MKAPLTKLIPKETFLKLKNLPHELKIETIKLADEAWLSHEFGSKEEIAEVFYKADIRNIVRIVYRLMSNESKQIISKINIQITDEDGNQFDVKSNIDKILYLSDTDDVKPMISALLASRGASMPEELVEDDQVQGDKKKARLKK